MRKLLLEHLTNELEPYVKFRASDPLALYIHMPRSPLVYPELAGTERKLFNLHYTIVFDVYFRNSLSFCRSSYF